MPANIAHMLIAHKAVDKLRDKGIPEYAEIVNILLDNTDGRNYQAYMNLGSMGPDLFYYSSLLGAAKDMIIDGYVQAKGVEPWSYQLHSIRPNEFPLKLVEIVFRDVKREDGNVVLEVDDIRKLAFIAGYLSHIAADQTIHPVVNRIAGPYYRSGDARKKHRTCEVFQDYYLYDCVYRLEDKQGMPTYKFFEQDFKGWADCIPRLTPTNTEDWFRHFLQRGFVETYGSFPPESDIENAVDNLLAALRVCKLVGPYKTAAAEYEEDGEQSNSYQEFVKNLDYLRYYRSAVELTVVYLMALYEVFLLLTEGGTYSAKQQRDRFCSIVQEADLSCPLEEDILGKATRNLRNANTMEDSIKDRIHRLVSEVQLLEAKEILDKARSDAEIVKG